VTIPYAGVCVGSGKTAREGTLRGGDTVAVTGVCPACSGRFDLDHDRLVVHETAAEDERETGNALEEAGDNH
jgi:hypothetical protein